MRLHCFFAVNSSISAAGDHLAGGSFTEKELNKDCSQNYVISLCGVVVRCNHVEPMVPGSSPTKLFFSFFLFFSVFFFCVVVFYKYIAK